MVYLIEFQLIRNQVNGMRREKYTNLDEIP